LESENLKKEEIIAIFAFVSLSAIIALLLAMAPSANNNANENLQMRGENAILQCPEEGEVACDAGGCPGVRRCSGGAWLSCIPVRECSPGREVPCALNACDFGVVKCDSCGQWGECNSN